jgi:hypothetical protein
MSRCDLRSCVLSFGCARCGRKLHLIATLFNAVSHGVAKEKRRKRQIFFSTLDSRSRMFDFGL